MPFTNETVLSVIVPARNAGRWIGELLESVLAQHVVECEVLVIDNGSEDDTAAAVEEFRALDSRIVLVRSEAPNAAAARNLGVSLASGKYLVFADSDDLVPDGAYIALLEALESSGSDMALGDHLKFSPVSTWRPTERWGAFDEALLGVSPTQAAGLVATRPCWNRMFRRSFWVSSGLHFPEIGSLEDMVPMTQSLVQARQIDIVAGCVYLYRDRGEDGSISARSDSVATVRYLEQEAHCLTLLRDAPELLDHLAGAVFDADGWVHLSRFLARRPSEEELVPVREAFELLRGEIPLDRLETASPERRVVWDLVLADRWDAAAMYVAGTASTSEPEQQLIGWAAACAALVGAPAVLPGAIDNLRSGVLRALVNHAEAATDTVVETLVAQLPSSQGGHDVQTDSDLSRAMRAAIDQRDVELVKTVSGLRRVLPLVVHTAQADKRGLSIAGSSADDTLVQELRLALRGTGDVVVVPVNVVDGAWSARVDAEALHDGRWRVLALLQGTEDEFPVVTARMALPPVRPSFPLQPLADRRDGWRFLLDRRRPRGRITAILSRALRRTR